MIFIVEDNETILSNLKFLFEEKKYLVIGANSIKDAKKLLEDNRESIDIIILDITLKDGSGLNFYEENIKNDKIPTIFLTALDSESDIVKGLNLGADDYITKPFSSLELYARVNRILKRVGENKKIKIGNVIYDTVNMEVYKNNEWIELTSMERKIVNLLFSNKGNIVTREFLLEKIWEWTGNDVDDHTLTVYIKRIKDKLGDDIIKTIKKVGYKVDG